MNKLRKRHFVAISMLTALLVMYFGIWLPSQVRFVAMKDNFQVGDVWRVEIKPAEDDGHRKKVTLENMNNMTKVVVTDSFVKPPVYYTHN